MKHSFTVEFSFPPNEYGYHNPEKVAMFERDGTSYVRLSRNDTSIAVIPAASFSEFVDALSEFAEHNGLYDKRWRAAFPAEAPEDTRSA